MGFVPPDLAAEGTELTVDVRGKPFAVRVVPRPFYKRPKPRTRTEGDALAQPRRPQVHERARVGSTRGRHWHVGITDYAQDQLGDIVFVDLPASGTAVTQMEKFGEIESVKAVSELFSPVTGEVVEVNDALDDNPELVNDDPTATAGCCASA